MNHKSTLVLFLLFTALTCTVRAQLYSFTNSTTGAYSSVGANTTGVGLIRFNGASAPGTPCGSGFSSTSFSSTTSYSTSLGGVEADLTAAGGYALNITDFSVGIRRSNTGPADVRLAYSIDGGITWIDKGVNDAPNNASCGNTTTATWTTPITVPSPTTLQFRIYCFGASGGSGTFQILNLNINGSVSPLDSIFTTATIIDPFCDNMNDSISLPFTTSSGTMSGLYYVQLSDASGSFPNNATANLISTGDSVSPLSAVIPAYTPWANGYRVRVVHQTPLFYGSGDNGTDIVINHSDTASFSITSDRSATCAGDTITFTAANILNGGTSPSIIWYMGTDSFGADVSSSIIASTSDSAYATLSSNQLCATPAVVRSSKIGFTVYQPSGIAFYDVICPGTTESFRGRTLTTAGTYSDTLNTVNGCDSIIYLYLTVKPTMRDTASASICQGMSYTHNGQTIMAAGAFSDTVACDTIHTLMLTVHPLPSPVITQQPVQTLSTGVYSSYQWYIDGQAIQGATTGTYTAGQATGYYTVAVTDSNGCTDTASIRLVHTGINELGMSDIRIYPNPTNGLLHIEVPAAITIAAITICEEMGRVVVSKTADSGLATDPIDLSGYGTGIYILTIKDANAYTISKTISVIQK